MITVISTAKLNNKTYYVLTCEICKNQFVRLKTWVDFKINKNNIQTICCSKKCTDSSKIKEINVECFLCKKQYKKNPSQAKRGKHSFCSASCRSTFNNKNKNWGSTRSKIEYFLENKLKKELCNVIFLCNDRTAIGSELDFYFPGLHLAVQINGITHYKPIYGQNKLNRINQLDKEKYNLCKTKSISLLIIDVSKDKKNDKLINEKHWQTVKYFILQKLGKHD